MSDKEGRPIFDLRDCVRIEIPGVVANVVDTIAGDHHKREHPNEWTQYLLEKESGNFSEHQGTLLSSWPQLNAAQALEMKHYKFYTVEHVAGASDAQIMAIGMLAGMSPLSLRDKANAYLAAAATRKEDTSLRDELAKRDQDIAELRQMLEDMRPKAGRPKKEVADA